MHFSFDLDILDFISESEVSMDGATPEGEYPHPDSEVPFINEDPVSALPLQAIEPDSNMNFNPFVVYTNLDLDILRSTLSQLAPRQLEKAKEIVKLRMWWWPTPQVTIFGRWLCMGDHRRPATHEQDGDVWLGLARLPRSKVEGSGWNFEVMKLMR
nr:hypothetical protein Iba_chr07eCG6770 [Ipomoea batatas]